MTDLLGGKGGGKLRKPNVDAMKPTAGPHHEPTEVWIKGANFDDGKNYCC